MATPIHVEVTKDVLRTEAFIARVQDDGAGAMATFTGVTRNTFNGKKVLRLEYEGYVPMAEAKLRELCSIASKRWSLKGIAVAHRLGVVGIGEASVVIAVSSAHRADALQACAWAIDELKATVPIWKKEYFDGGEDFYVDSSDVNRDCLAGQSPIGKEIRFL